MISIFAVRLSGGSKHEHIASVRWRNPDTDATGETSREEMVRWIRAGGSAYVCGKEGWFARIGVVDANPPYIQTYADGSWTDNLLSLGRF